MDSLDALGPEYRAILCDIWGVVHDGDRILPGAQERLLRWKGEGRTIILVTNAPRPAETVRRQLDALGLPRSAYDAITSSGEAGISALAVEAGTFNGQFTIGANGTSIKVIIADGTPIHRCVFISIVVLTPNGEVSWEEVASTGASSVFSRYVRINNLSGFTVSYDFKTFQLPL